MICIVLFTFWHGGIICQFLVSLIFFFRECIYLYYILLYKLPNEIKYLMQRGIRNKERKMSLIWIFSLQQFRWLGKKMKKKTKKQDWNSEFQIYDREMYFTFLLIYLDLFSNAEYQVNSNLAKCGHSYILYTI